MGKIVLILSFSGAVYTSKYHSGHNVVTILLHLAFLHFSLKPLQNNMVIMMKPDRKRRFCNPSSTFGLSIISIYTISNLFS